MSVTVSPFRNTGERLFPMMEIIIKKIAAWAAILKDSMEKMPASWRMGY